MKEPETLQAEGMTVRVERVAWRRSRYVLRLRPDGTVAALVPPRWSRTEVEKVLHKHRRWLAARAAEVAARAEARAARQPTHPASPLPYSWYKKAALAVMVPEVKRRAVEMKVKPSSVVVSRARRQWGSCTARGRISLSWRLLLVPKELRDYVIVHELAHLVHLNHGKRFWALVGKFVPDYVSKRRALNKLGGVID